MIRVGFIGTGGFTCHHVNILNELENIEVVGFVGSSHEKAETFAQGYPGTSGYSSLENMIANEQLDAVYICVPPMGHENYEELLIEHNIPFLVEKPLGIEEAKVRHIKHKVKETNHLTSVGYHFRYADIIDIFKDHLKNQETGIVLGKWMGSMPGVYWWRNQKQSGGQFNEQTTHIIDLIRYLFGEVKSVYAQEVNAITSKKDSSVTVADVGLFMLTLESGLLVQVSNTAVLPGGIGEVGIKVYTEKGMTEWQPGQLEMKTPNKVERFLAKHNPYKKEAEAFFHAVETGDRSKILSDYEEAWHSFKVALAAEKSISEKRLVDMNEISE